MKLIDKLAVVAKLKNIMRKKFRIINNEVYCPEAFHPYWYRIEQRYTILFFIHWWGTPEFEPPHNFEFVCDAIRHIKEHFPNAICLMNLKSKLFDTIELLNRLYKKAEEGYYDNKPAYQFSKDELNLKYYLGWIDKASYQLKKQRLEQRANEYYCLKRHYLLVI